jgi:hypothetical protein
MRGGGSISMAEAFHIKLAFVLKVLSVSRGAVAAEMGVDKSLVGRWVTGAVKPSAHNLTRLSDFVGQRAGGFAVLDWERPLANLAVFLGVDPVTAPGAGASADGAELLAPFVQESRSATARRGRAYEGFYRSTRPYSQVPGRFMHDHLMVRLDVSGSLRFEMTTSGVTVQGWVWLLQNQLFVISTEMTSGSFAYAILNGVNSVKADVLDGLMLSCALDALHTPIATPILIERIADLSGDVAADDARLAALGQGEPLAPEGSVPPETVRHLARDIGPGQVGAGGDWILAMPVSRSMSRGVQIPIA